MDLVENRFCRLFVHWCLFQYLNNFVPKSIAHASGVGVFWAAPNSVAPKCERGFMELAEITVKVCGWADSCQFFYDFSAVFQFAEISFAENCEVGSFAEKSRSRKIITT